MQGKSRFIKFRNHIFNKVFYNGVITGLGVMEDGMRPLYATMIMLAFVFGFSLFFYSGRPVGTTGMVAADPPECGICECDNYSLLESAVRLETCENSTESLKMLLLDHCEKPRQLFEQIIWNISRSYNYSEGEFDCDDFSRVVYEELSKAGYKVSYVDGYVYNSTDCEEGKCKHRWLEITLPIETITGSFPPPETYEKYYEPLE